MTSGEARAKYLEATREWLKVRESEGGILSDEEDDSFMNTLDTLWRDMSREDQMAMEEELESLMEAMTKNHV
jgi:hypothetical protein